jgi:lipopolysaccharide export LptBFGC system permease protein LptF
MLHAFVIVFVSLAGLYVVFDAFTNMEEFITRSGGSGGMARLLASYYGCRMVWFFDATSPIISLASAMFALSWLERHNELTALLAAGVTRWRIARPVLVFSAVVAVLAAANREFVLPGIRESFARNAQNLEGQVLQAFEPRYDNRTEIGLVNAVEKLTGQPPNRKAVQLKLSATGWEAWQDTHSKSPAQLEAIWPWRDRIIRVSKQLHLEIPSL